MSDGTNLSRIEAQLDTIMRLLALSVAAAPTSLKDKAVLLKRAGLSPKDIAALCDTTPNTVSVALSAAKRVRKCK